MIVILAIDDSQFSADALEEVAARSWPRDTTVRVLLAVEPLAPPPASELWYDAGGSIEQMQEQMTKRHERLVSQAVRLLQERGLSAEAVVRQGDARSVIVDEATEWPADLIIVGSHGYPRIKQWL